MTGYVKEPSQPAEACVIWMHGLGSNPEDMAGLAGELRLTVPVRHVFMEAPVRPVTLNGGMRMRAWYDIVGLTLNDRQDRDGVLSSEALIREIIHQQLADGFLPKQIFLAGFSQGGAMALFTGVRAPDLIGGVICLSAYLPLTADCDGELSHHWPVFVGSGLHDTLVLPCWTALMVQWLHGHGFNQVSCHEYPMDHAVCTEEVCDVTAWLTQQMVLNKDDTGVKQEVYHDNG